MIYWNSFGDFLHMGGYGVYVWGSFGVTALIMLVEPIVVARNRKRSEEHTSELQSRSATSYAVFCLKKNMIKVTTSYA